MVWRGWGLFAVMCSQLGCGGAPPPTRVALSPTKVEEVAVPAAPRLRLCSSVGYVWDAPVCLHEISEEQQRQRHWTYRLELEGERVLRCDAINGRGVLVDDFEGIASTLYFYDGKRTTGSEDRNRNGVVRRRTVFESTETGTTLEYWRDEQDRPLTLPKSHVLLRERVHDEAGHVLREILLGSDGEPRTNDEDVHETLKTYRGDALLTEAYFNRAGGKATRKDGVHEVRYGLDDWAERANLRYFGRRGEPVLSSDGMHETRYERDRVGNSLGWSFWGPDGAPLVGGQDKAHRARYARNESGAEIELAYFDLNGSPMTSAWGYSRRKRELDAKDAPVAWKHFSPSGEATRRNKGHFWLVSPRDQRGNTVTDVFLDVDGKKLMNRDGYAEARSTYDARDNLIKLEYLDTNGAAVSGREGYATRVYERDGDRLVALRYLDARGTPANSLHGYAVQLTSYRADGDPHYSHVDAAGDQVEPAGWCSNVYDESSRAKVTTEIDTWQSCVTNAETQTLSLRLIVQPNGRPRRFYELGAGASDAARECLTERLQRIKLPTARDCTLLPIQLETRPPAVKLLSLGKEPELPPG